MQGHGDLAKKTFVSLLDRRYLLLRALTESFVVGVSCAAISLFSLVMVRVIKLREMRSDMAKSLEVTSADIVEHLGSASVFSRGLLMPGVVAPLLETLLFLFVFLVINPQGGQAWRGLLFVVTMGLLSWALHGASYVSATRVIPFAMLAILFLRWSKRDGLTLGFMTASVAHMVWNTSLLLAASFMRRGTQ